MQCIIRILDEVNCQIQGLPVSLRQQLVKQYKIAIPHARYMPAVRLGRWDGCRAFFQLNGSTYVNLLPDIVPELTALGYEIQVQDQRKPVQLQFEPVHADTYAQHCWPSNTTDPEPVQLRPHQVQLINSLLHEPQALIVAATGSGKTLVLAALSERCTQLGRTVTIVPNKSLVLQTCSTYQLLGLDVGVWYGDEKQLGHAHTICTWQSLHSLVRQRRKNLDSAAAEQLAQLLSGVVAVLVDECHILKADEVLNLLTGALASVPVRWAMTGTIPKDAMAQQCLRCCIGSVVNQVQAAELQQLGILSQCHVHIRQLTDPGAYTDYAAELKYLLLDPARQQQLAQLIASIASTGSTLVLLDRVQAGQALSALLPGSVFVSGQHSVSQRQQQYQQLDQGQQQLLLATYGIASTGIDIVNVRNVVLLEPGKSFVRTIQSIGRGLRRNQQKQHVDIWDISSTLKFSRRHLNKRREYYREAQYPHSVKKINWC